MKDINFFLPYIEKRKVKFNNKFYLFVLFLIVSLSILGYGVINQLKINKLAEKEIQFKKVAQNSEVVQEVEAIKIEEDDLNKFKLEVENIRDLKASLAKKEFIGSSYIETIINKRPNDLFLTSLYITPENVSITGISNNRLSVAEFAKGLKSIEGFENTFISNITKEEVDYKFQLENSFVKEEVVEDGENEEGQEESQDKIEEE